MPLPPPVTIATRVMVAARGAGQTFESGDAALRLAI